MQKQTIHSKPDGLEDSDMRLVKLAQATSARSATSQQTSLFEVSELMLRCISLAAIYLKLSSLHTRCKMKCSTEAKATRNKIALAAELSTMLPTNDKANSHQGKDRKSVV